MKGGECARSFYLKEPKKRLKAVRRPAAAARARPVGGEEDRNPGPGAGHSRLESDLVPVGQAVNVWSENDDLLAGRCAMESGWSLSH